MKRYLLLQDIRSTFRRDTLYGRKNETVTEVATHGNVVIVQGRSGRFPVRLDYIVDLITINNN